MHSLYKTHNKKRNKNKNKIKFNWTDDERISKRFKYTLRMLWQVHQSEWKCVRVVECFYVFVFILKYLTCVCVCMSESVDVGVFYLCSTISFLFLSVLWHLNKGTAEPNIALLCDCSVKRGVWGSCYPHIMQRPWSSFIWIFIDHHFDMEYSNTNKNIQLLKCIHTLTQRKR